MGATLAARLAGLDDFVAVDMGGTSYDLCLVRKGRPEIKTDWNWRYRYYIGMPMVDVQSVGAGGGSIARVRQGALLVGPDSAGSMPGPVCYGRGGTLPTVTDADVVLGYLPVTGFAGGRMQLDVDAAREAIRREVAEPLGIDVIEAAWGIERIVNANMANATRKVLAGHGADPRELALIAYGGNGGVHAWAIAPELGIETVLVPKTAPAFSALGVLVADYVIDLVRSYVAPLSQLDVQRVRVLAGELLDEARKELEPADLEPGSVSYDLYAQMCYPGQNFDLSVAMPGELVTAPADTSAPRARRCSSWPSASTISTNASGASVSATCSRCCEACAWSVGAPRRSRAGSRAVAPATARRRRRAVRPTSTARSATPPSTPVPASPPAIGSRVPHSSRSRSRWWSCRRVAPSSWTISGITCCGADGPHDVSHDLSRDVSA